MMRELTLANRTISAADPVLVIAEIGVNHDGCLERALELVEAARLAGADAVKVQLFTADALMSAHCSFAGYQAARCEEPSAREMLRRYELSADEVRTVVGAIEDARLIPIATPFSISDVETIESLGLPA